MLGLIGGREAIVLTAIRNNQQHSDGVKRVMQDYRNADYQIPIVGPVATDVAGFENPRFYDFIAYDPIANEYVGVEVKTTIIGRPSLKGGQVAKDIAVANGGGVVRSTGIRLDGVAYRAVCFGCKVFTSYKSARLYYALRAANIPVHMHHAGPGH